MKRKHLVLVFSIFFICLFTIRLLSILGLNLDFQRGDIYSEEKANVLSVNTDNTKNKVISRFEYVDCVNSELFLMIKDTYSKIDFNGDFNRGNLEKYPLYKKQFRKLLNNESPFIDKDTGKTLYLNEYEFIARDFSCEEYVLNKYNYYFFDMDNDGGPELCITDKGNFTYIIKYDEDLNQFFLWKRYPTTWIFLIGSQKVGYAGVQKYAFFKLDENGNDEYFLWYRVEGYTDSRTGAGYCYMVTLPQYTMDNEHIQLTAQMKKYAYYDEDQKLYYFRVTEEQFNELTKKFLSARELAYQNIKEVTFTYQEIMEDQ